MEKPMELRGHHLLMVDIAMRKGVDTPVLREITKRYGYGADYMDKHFIPTMTRLLENPDMDVLLTDKQDEFCDGCGNACACKLNVDKRNIPGFDKETIEGIGGTVGKTIKVRELLPLIKDLGLEEEKRILALLGKK